MTLAAILLSILLALLSDEFLSWIPRLATWLVRRSVEKLPAHLRERLLEEWLADINECPGRLTKLVIAFDTNRAALLIGHRARLPDISCWSAFSVRLFDVSGSILLLIVGAPACFFVFISILIETKGHGPIFFRQLRIGLDERPFYVLKFATFSARSKSHTGKVVGSDRKMTKTGKIINALRLDEYPQTLNVLKGEMSFVGPRPEKPELVAVATRFIDNYSERFRVRPGITGHAQLEYPYGRSIDDHRKKLKYDLDYIRSYSFLLNLSLLVRTSYIVFFNFKKEVE